MSLDAPLIGLVTPFVEKLNLFVMPGLDPGIQEVSTTG